MLVLSIVLTLSFVTPAFAWDPKGPNDMPEDSENGLDNAYSEMVAGFWGSSASWFNSEALEKDVVPHAGYGPVIARYMFRLFFNQ